ncbi:hypothetical protein DFH06DRAFT_1298530 [Mycena polygramma]|nr:hypothetical protein DFH06DRAFT_1298530 [Mycena polygramma]
MRTLCSKKTLMQPYLIRRLALTDGGQSSTDSVNAEAQRKTAISLLRNLYTPNPDSGTAKGSALRVLHWNMATGLEKLGDILGASDNFPNLSELAVSCNNTNSNFKFIQVKGLEVLRLSFSFYFYGLEDVGDNMCHRLEQAMQMLPVTSPLLHTLQLKLQTPYDEDTFPHSGLSALVSAINLIRLPVLATVNIAVDLTPEFMEEFDDLDDVPGFDTDFAPFLAAHPNLVDLTLSAEGTQLTEDITFLPRLRSFKGSFEDSVIICAPKPNELSPAAFAQLVSSFPNLTHVDVCLAAPMSEYRKHLSSLGSLQYLRLQEYRTTRNSSGNVAAIFPSTDYIREIGFLLPYLTQLERIEIHLFADHVSSRHYDEEDGCDSDYDSAEESCPCCRRGLLMGPSDMEAEYLFSTVRNSGGDAHVVLDNARTSW